MSAHTLRGVGRAAVGLLVVGIVAACDFDRPTIFEPIGDPSYDFAMINDGRGVPRGTVSIGFDTLFEPDSDLVTKITLRGLESLTSGVYQVWLANVNGDALENVTPAVGTRIVVRTDTTFTPEGDPIPAAVTVDSTAGASTLTLGGPAITTTLVVSEASLGADPQTFDVMIVSLEPAAGAGAPTTIPLWARGIDAEGNVTISFGNFAADPADQYVFVSTGRGRGGIRGNVMIVDDSALARPPVGYYYATWAVRRDGSGNPVDTLALGEQTAPFPDRDVSLRNADTDDVHPVVLDFPMEILAASSRIELTGPNPFAGFQDVWVTLENKLGDENASAPTIILSGLVPSIVSNP
jgi:hypothetical protein